MGLFFIIDEYFQFMFALTLLCLHFRQISLEISYLCDKIDLIGHNHSDI
jgi:hypothetical protein